MAKKILMLCGDFTEDYETMVPFRHCLCSAIRLMLSARIRKPVMLLRQPFMISLVTRLTPKSRDNFALTADFDTVNTADYVGLFITGGRAPEYIRLNPESLKLFRNFSQLRNLLLPFATARRF